MKKRLSMDGVDCANCAGKMEHAVSKMEGVNNCSISFMTQRMTLDYNDDIPLNDLIKNINTTIKKIDKDCSVVMA